jgi:hypothetical protein
MKQVLHIFAKDARHFWPEVLISFVVLGALVAIEPATWSLRGGTYAVSTGRVLLPDLMDRSFLSGMLKVLIPISWWLLIARVVHAEALVGDRQFWLTRPYEWKNLLAAKLLFMLLFLYLPFFLAQCFLLLQAGFHPFSVIPGLLFSLLLVTGSFVLPVFAITTVTSTFVRFTGALLAILAIFIGYITISLLLTDHAWLPVNALSFPVAMLVLSIVVVLQYATRRVRLTRMLLVGLPVLVVLIGLVVPQSTAIEHEYAPAGSGQTGPMLTPQPAPVSYLQRNQQVLLSLSFQVSGVASGYALLADQVKVTLTSADGRHWTSPWQGIYNLHYLPGSGNWSINVMVDRVFFDQAKALPVTLHYNFALTQLRAGETRSISLPDHDFSVPDFGICSPDGDPETAQLRGLRCRFALHPPELTYVTASWADGPCSLAGIAPAPGVQGDAWVGSLDHAPAEFGISPISTPSIAISNAIKPYPARSEQRELCPGSPLTFTQYQPVRRMQFELTIPGFRLPSYQPSRASLSGTPGTP